MSTRVNIAGFDIDVEGLDVNLQQLLSGEKISPEITLNQPSIYVNTKEVIKYMLPYFVIAMLIIISILLSIKAVK